MCQTSFTVHIPGRISHRSAARGNLPEHQHQSMDPAISLFLDLSSGIIPQYLYGLSLGSVTMTTESSVYNH